MGDRFPFGLPSGWYAVAASDEVAAGQVMSRRYFDREIVLYRTRSGEVGVVDAFCPHMGAHLGRVGCVEGDLLRCGFHGFRFDRSGRCVGTEYDSPPPARARLRPWAVREHNGLILTWFDPEDRAPEWEVPELEPQGWTSIRWRRYAIDTHPQETTENSVDFGHFTRLHGFIEGQITRPLATDGPLLTSSYRANRPYGLPGRPPSVRIPVEYHVSVWGLGYSQVNVEIRSLGLDLRQWVLPVPKDDEHIDLILGTAVSTKWGVFAPLVRMIAHRVLCKEVEKDLDVWTYKTFVERPALAKGDGPIAAYRRWARQFYPGAESADSALP